MRKLSATSVISVVFAAACLMQATMAAGAGNDGNANNGAKPSVAVVPAPLTSAEMDAVAAVGGIVIDPYGIGVIIRNNNGSGGSASFVRDNPANGATICKNVNCPAGN